MQGIYANVYFAGQRARGGVRREMIARAGRLLDAPWETLAAYLDGRLRAVHGHHARREGWLQRQPLVVRTQLLDEVARLTAGGRLPPGVERRRTSGSTGTPFAFVKDREMSAWMDAAMWAAYAWHGVAPGAPHARFWGMPPAPRARLKVRIRDQLMNRRRVSAFELGPGQVDAHFHALRRLRPAYAYGYPTLMRAFAHECRARGLDGRELGLRRVISTGELLTPDTRALLADFFGCRVVNEYGCTESGVLGMECEHGTLHAVPVAAYPEVVDDAGRPAAPGQPGEVVVSDLYGAVLPLLRYRLHDRARPAAGGCACGRALPALRVDMGRIDSFIQTPARGPVYDAILAYTVPAGVQRFRAYQLAVDRLAVDLVPGAGFDRHATPRSCQARWEQALGPGMHVAVRTVQDLPYEASGKLRYFVPMSSADAALALAEAP